MRPREDLKLGTIQSVLEYRMLSMVATCQGAQGQGLYCRLGEQNVLLFLARDEKSPESWSMVVDVGRRW